jgi:hypothetical protein
MLGKACVADLSAGDRFVIFRDDGNYLSICLLERMNPGRVRVITDWCCRYSHSVVAGGRLGDGRDRLAFPYGVGNLK